MNDDNSKIADGENAARDGPPALDEEPRRKGGGVTAYTALERRDAHRDGFAGLYNLLALWYRWLRPDAALSVLLAGERYL